MERQVPLRVVLRLFVVLLVGIGLMVAAYHQMNPEVKHASFINCPTPPGYLFPPDCGAVTPVPCPTPVGDIFPPGCPATVPQRAAAQVQQVPVPVQGKSGKSGGAVGSVIAPTEASCTTPDGTVYILQTQ